ncbi:hypothetical protein GCM10011381_08850 [Klenkia taihuensis]|nr:hypothetical protein GCM10011381_08850 [Klenkia taihuensis]
MPAERRPGAQGHRRGDVERLAPAYLDGERAGEDDQGVGDGDGERVIWPSVVRAA